MNTSRLLSPETGDRRWPGEGRKPLSVRLRSLTGPSVDGIRLSVPPVEDGFFRPNSSDLHQRGWPFHHIRHIDALRRPDHCSMAAVSFLLQTEDCSSVPGCPGDRPSRAPDFCRTAHFIGEGTFLSVLPCGRPPSAVRLLLASYSIHTR